MASETLLTEWRRDLLVVFLFRRVFVAIMAVGVVEMLALRARCRRVLVGGRALATMPVAWLDTLFRLLRRGGRSESSISKVSLAETTGGLGAWMIGGSATASLWTGIS
jgi:hypothetical protein